MRIQPASRKHVFFHARDWDRITEAAEDLGLSASALIRAATLGYISDRQRRAAPDGAQEAAFKTPAAARPGR
jgi:hypothetical protein